MASFAEGLALAEHAEVDLSALLEIISLSAIAAPMFALKVLQQLTANCSNFLWLTYELYLKTGEDYISKTQHLCKTSVAGTLHDRWQLLASVSSQTPGQGHATGSGAGRHWSGSQNAISSFDGTDISAGNRGMG